MRYYLIIISLIILTTASYSQPHSFERADQHDILPVIADIVPDSGFTRLSYSMPNNPKCELIYGNHLYLGCGAILKIYELGEDGQPVLTGQRQTYDLIWDMDHDGEYLYVANGYRGITIYDGNDYENPAEISHIQEESVVFELSVYGDSLYYIYNNGVLSIMNIVDRANPFVEHQYSYDSLGFGFTDRTKIRKYQDYLFGEVGRRNGSWTYYIGIIELHHSSGIPTMVDSIYLPSSDLSEELQLFDNRLYVIRRHSFHIYELNDSHHPVFKSSFEYDGGFAGSDEASINNSRIVFLGRCIDYPNYDSLYTTISAIQLDDLTNPILIDSTNILNNAFFTDIIHYENYTYSFGNHGWYQEGYMPGLFVYQWHPDFSSELIGHYREYSFCCAVAAKDDIAYAGTIEEPVSILDVTDKTDPLVVGEIAGVYYPTQMKIVNDRLYILLTTKLIIYDISDPNSPAEIGRLQLQPGGVSINFNVQDDMVYISYWWLFPNGQGWLLIADVSDPQNIITHYDEYIVWGQSPSHLDYPLIFLLSGYNGAYVIYNISDPAVPYRYSSVNLNFGPTACVSNGSLLYIFGGAEEIWDISNLYSPESLIWRHRNAVYNDVQLVDGKLFMTDFNAPGVYVRDIESSPLEMPDIAYYCCTYVWGYSSIDLPYVYIPAGEQGLVILRFDDLTGIDDETKSMPENDTIILAYPNPFNSTVSFQIQTDSESSDNLKVFDIAGRLVRDINIPKNNFGYATIQWDGKNEWGNDVSSGIYFARYGSGPKQAITKVVLLR